MIITVNIRTMRIWCTKYKKKFKSVAVAEAENIASREPNKIFRLFYFFFFCFCFYLFGFSLSDKNHTLFTKQNNKYGQLMTNKLTLLRNSNSLPAVFHRRLFEI